MQKALFLALIISVVSCRKPQPKPLSQGVWRAEMQVTETEMLPFNFEVTSPNTLKIFNAEEVILVDDISYRNDSVIIKMPVFEGYIAAKMNDTLLEGAFIKESLNRVVPFKAVWNKKMRFETPTQQPSIDVSGNWEAVFSPGVDGDEYIAKGIFEQNGSKVTGTFRTTTGDYRYLEGVIDGNELKLSTFDGSHVFLFTATIINSAMEGMFYSGNHWKERFVAKRNEAFELPDENELTYLKDGYDSIDFSFPDTTGNKVSVKDERFRNKVVVVQVMGTWCPNCLDESKYYSEYYKNNKNKDVEFIALAFEYAKTKDDAFNNINRLKDNLGVEYPILLAQYGSSDKGKAQEKLPMLNHVLSYPTSIIIDKAGKVRKIHTGFNGPATGEKYVTFKKEFEGFVGTLLEE
ncbi:MAG: TlpA family protein disulfide reductase [Gelidibacter sp.]|nr:TlpA family protein disulfide reductase [Gelidibacter sp.]